MKILRRIRISLSFVAVLAIGAFVCKAARADDEQFERGRKAIESMMGCYLVDYSYTETESLKSGYVRDNQVYDVNKNKSVKEWIYAEEISPRRVRLQHVLFATDLSGDLISDSLLKHQAEDWEYEAPFLYEFTVPFIWMVKELKSSPRLWTRRITNLDDGPRYECAASWSLSTAFPDWSCSNYAPIPGRETRDMGRKDYNALQRGTRIVVYAGSWLERQDNVKTIDRDGVRTPLAREAGKNWYVRLPDSECASARAFTQKRQSFWSLLRETWDEVLVGDRPFVEKAIPGQPPRFVKIFEIQEECVSKNLSDPATRKTVKDAILKVIADYRAS
jgi:hypothetical protein